MTKLLAYHGSQHKKFNFNENKVLYLTTDKEKAISYAKREWDEGLIEGEIPVVYTFEISIENPYRTKGTEKEFFDFCDSMMNEEGGKEDLIEKGYDSIIHNDLIGVFYPSQVEFKELQILPKSHKYYYTNEDGIDPNDVDDYYYDEDDDELDESIVYASKKDLSDIILMNPTRKELKDNNISLARYCYDNEGNFYFGNANNLTHNDIILNIENKFGITLYDDIGFYDVNKNCFYIKGYFADEDEYNEELRSAKRKFSNEPLLKQLFGDFNVDIFQGETPEKLDESVEDNFNSKNNCKVVLKDGRTIYGRFISKWEDNTGKGIFLGSSEANKIREDKIAELYIYYDCEVKLKDGRTIYGNFVGDYGDHKLHLDDAFNRKGWAIKDELIDKVNYKKVLRKELNESVEDKILYIIRGVPGSGKSTLAHKLTDNVVEADQFFYDDEGNYNWSADKLHWAHRQCFETVKKYMEEGRNKIAVANTFVKTKDYKNYVELAEQFGYKVDIRVCNGNYKSIHNVPEETIEKMKRKFQESVDYTQPKVGDLYVCTSQNKYWKDDKTNTLWKIMDIISNGTIILLNKMTDDKTVNMDEGMFIAKNDLNKEFIKHSDYQGSDTELDESVNDKPQIGDLYVCKIGDETYQRSLWEITAISDDKEFYTITRVENPNPHNKAYLSVNKITLPKWFEKYKDYQGSDTELDESIIDKPQIGDIYELQITENKGQLFEVTKILPYDFYEITSLTRIKGHPLGYVEYLEISEKNLKNWFRRYDDYKYEGDDTQLDESKINKEINVKEFRNNLIGIELEPNERFGKCRIVDVYSTYMFTGWENLFRLEEEDTGKQIMVTLDEMKDIFHFDIEKYDTDRYNDGSNTELDESVEKVWPDGSMFTASDGVWQIYGNDGENYELKQYCSNGITIKWKLSMSEFPSKGMVPCKNNNYNGDDTELDESIILKEGIEEVKKYFPNIPEDMFQTLVDLDPTYQGGNVLGKFGKWILNLYNKKLLKDEDFYKVTEYLITFKDNFSKMPNKDIMSYKTLPDLAKAVQPFEGQKDVSNKQKSRDAKKGGKKILETNEWLVICPKTEEAACYYGANTKWCTAAKKDNMFDAYNRDGPLYIFINKQNNEKYQMHAESLSFMNELDEPVPPLKVINDKKVQDLIKEILDHERDDINFYDYRPLEGLNWGEADAYIATSVFNLMAVLFSTTKQTYKMLDVLKAYLVDYRPNVEYIEQLYCDFNGLEMSTEEIRKACESLETTNNAEYEDVMLEIKQTMMNQINEESPYFKIYAIKYDDNYDELELFVKTEDGTSDYIDIILNWFLNENSYFEAGHILDEIGSYIKHPRANFTELTSMFCKFIDELVDEQKELKSMKESIIKNPSFEDIQQMLKEQDLGFTFNPIKNDLTIYKDISFLKESNDISGILSPKVAEVKTDDEEYTRKALSNTLKKIYPSGYQLIIY